MKKTRGFKLGTGTVLGVALTLATMTSFAGSDPDPKDLHQPIMSQNIQTDPNYFRANEWQADVFGVWAAPESGPIHSGGGGGAGINYFFTRYFGVGVEGIGFDGGSTADTVSMGTVNFIARYPIESIHLAPYAFVGIGGAAMTGDKEAQGDGGLGVEYRFTRNWGVFADGRYVACDDTNNYGLARLGVRMSF